MSNGCNAGVPPGGHAGGPFLGACEPSSGVHKYGHRTTGHSVETQEFPYKQRLSPVVLCPHLRSFDKPDSDGSQSHSRQQRRELGIPAKRRFTRVTPRRRHVASTLRAASAPVSLGKSRPAGTRRRRARPWSASRNEKDLPPNASPLAPPSTPFAPRLDFYASRARRRARARRESFGPTRRESRNQGGRP